MHKRQPFIWKISEMFSIIKIFYREGQLCQYLIRQLTIKAKPVFKLMSFTDFEKPLSLKKFSKSRILASRGSRPINTLWEDGLLLLLSRLILGEELYIASKLRCWKFNFTHSCMHKKTDTDCPDPDALLFVTHALISLHAVLYFSKGTSGKSLGLKFANGGCIHNSSSLIPNQLAIWL